MGNQKRGHTRNQVMQKSIFITGAAAGIGAETARLFARNGWLVGASDVSAAGLQALQQELGSDKVSPHVADVRDAGALAAAVRSFTGLTDGRLDAAFANAGVLFMGPDESVTPEEKNLLVDVNVKGVLHTVDAVFPFLKATPGAHLVAMSSTSAEYGSPHHAVYSATKFFVRGYTEALNIEYRAHDIQVSAIYVAYVQTGMVFEAKVKPASIETLGVKIRPQQVAEHVWRAVHGRRSHWRVGLDARLLNLSARLFGSALAPVYRRLMKI
jgi:NADP-dependent 3-hydroxy acid dehydrogenase YdfG